jgi:outer membrane lipoprotein carrier protein
MRIIGGCLFLAFLQLCFVPGVHQGEDDPGLDGVIASLQDRYDRLNSFSCDFTQVQWNKALNRKEEESGRVFMKKPGMMRWAYETPETKLFIAKGGVFIFYLPGENQVQRYEAKNTTTLSAPTLFLAGAGNLEREFHIAFVESELPGVPGDAYELELLPRTGEENFESLILAVNRNSFLVERLVMIDLLGNRAEFIFENIRENAPVAESLFDFEMPPDADLLIVN